jgi:signal transduction histidine kinase
MKMHPPTDGWSRRYQTALRQHLRQRLRSSLASAATLGHQAVSRGMETLDVARIHERALTALAPPGGTARTRQRMIERAKRFFDETIVPIERTHRAALKTDLHVRQMSKTLRRRTVESAASTRHLKQGVALRQAAEAALKKSGTNRLRLLEASTRLQTRLRRRTHTILAAQEDERQTSSRQLHDEIAQILLAINLKLLTVRTSAKANTENLKKEIAATRKLLQESLITINRLAHKCGIHHET